MSTVDEPDESDKPGVSKGDDPSAGDGQVASSGRGREVTGHIELGPVIDRFSPGPEEDRVALVVGRHRVEPSGRPPVLAAAAAAMAVSAVLIAVGALSRGGAAPDAAPSGSPTPVETITTIAALPPSPVSTVELSATASTTPSSAPATTRTTAPANTAPVAPTTTTTPPSNPTTTAPPTTAAPSPTPSLLTVAPQTMNLRGAPGRCFDLNANNRVQGAVVQSWECNTTPAQRWSYTADFTLRAGSFCAGPVTMPPAAGALMQLGTCSGSDVQWRFRSDGRLVNPASGLCVADPGWATGEDRQLVLADCGGPGQQWTILTPT